VGAARARAPHCRADHGGPAACVLGLGRSRIAGRGFSAIGFAVRLTFLGRARACARTGRTARPRPELGRARRTTGARRGADMGIAGAGLARRRSRAARFTWLGRAVRSAGADAWPGARAVRGTWLGTAAGAGPVVEPTGRGSCRARRAVCAFVEPARRARVGPCRGAGPGCTRPGSRKRRLGRTRGLGSPGRAGAAAHRGAVVGRAREPARARTGSGGPSWVGLGRATRHPVMGHSQDRRARRPARSIVGTSGGTRA
jgi:hypothetical protein